MDRWGYLADGDATTPRARGRLMADSNITVSDLMKPLADFMTEHGTRDLAKLTACPVVGVSWKSAPCVRWLAGLAPLHAAYAKVAPNTLLPSKKHKVALERLHQEASINFTKSSDADFFDMLDDRIRVAFKHYRELLQCSLTKERAFKKGYLKHHH
jgi:hypothetical protein